MQEKTPNLNLTITLEVHEGDVEGDYSIEGTERVHGFSFVVRMITFIQQQFEIMYQHTFIYKKRYADCHVIL